jgi:hypothetical protein
VAERPAPRLLVATYGLFAVAAGARSTVQLATYAGRAPLAYSLSAVAAVTYITVSILLRRNSSRARIALRRLCVVELVGVLVVGTLSLLDRAAFPDATVWSGYGVGYGLVPAVLPIIALAVLAPSRPARHRQAYVPAEEI